MHDKVTQTLYIQYKLIERPLANLEISKIETQEIGDSSCVFPAFW